MRFGSIKLCPTTRLSPINVRGALKVALQATGPPHGFAVVVTADASHLPGFVHAPAEEFSRPYADARRGKASAPRRRIKSLKRLLIKVATAIAKLLRLGNRARYCAGGASMAAIRLARRDTLRAAVLR